MLTLFKCTHDFEPSGTSNRINKSANLFTRKSSLCIRVQGNPTKKNINSDSCHIAVKPLLKVTQPIISPLWCTSKGRRTKNQSIFSVAAPCSPFFIRIVVCDYTQKFLMISWFHPEHLRSFFPLPRPHRTSEWVTLSWSEFGVKRFSAFLRLESTIHDTEIMERNCSARRRFEGEGNWVRGSW